MALAVNALDVTTSLVPYWIDTGYATPPRSATEWTLQLGLMLAGLVWLAPRVPALLRGVAALPIPRAPLIVCGAFLLMEAGHVAFRYERFPFSPVAMFSDAWLSVPETWEQNGYLVQHPDGPRFFSFQREGDRWFARYFVDLDYKGSAALRMYRDKASVQTIVTRAVTAAGLPPPQPVRYRYRTRDGEVIAVQPRTLEQQ